jgi:hypothetical protein
MTDPMGDLAAEPIEPIRRSVTVRLEPERAFDLFTAEIDTWWPVETHSRAASEFEGEGVKVERVEFERRAGGRVLEHLSNGHVLPWAEILVWERPARFVLAWKPHPRPQPPTEVEVRFVPADGGTRVELEHRGWERLDVDIAPVYRSYDDGWVATLERFAAAAAHTAA